MSSLSCRNCRYRWMLALALAASLGLLSGVTSALAADPKKGDEIPLPEEVALETKDGVFLRCTYYPGMNGKTTVPIIIIHDHKGQRTDFHEFALFLQKNAGHAIIVPDLRGHGESKKYRKPNGEIGEIDLAKLKTANFADMVTQDMQTTKNFLREKNNAGELNLEELCLIGVGPMGSVTALNFALVDWNRQTLIGYKLGQDVKALVLVSPVQFFEGNKATIAITNPIVGGKLSTMLIGGTKDKAEINTINRQLESKHAKVPKDPAERLKYQDLFVVTLNTEVRSTKLLDPRLGLGLDNKILNFIELRLVNKQDEMPWSERKSPNE